MAEGRWRTRAGPAEESQQLLRWGRGASRGAVRAADLWDGERGGEGGEAMGRGAACIPSATPALPNSAGGATAVLRAAAASAERRKRGGSGVNGGSPPSSEPHA